MSEVEFHGCSVISDRHFLCEGRWAWQDTDDNSCEIAPLKPHKALTCQFVEANSEHMWQTLDERRQWIFKTTLNATLHVLCDQKRQDLFILPQQGVLTLASGCSVQVGKTHLPATSNRNVTVEGSFGIRFMGQVINIKADTLQPLGSHMINEMARIKKGIRQFQEARWTLKGLNLHHATSFLTISIAIVVIVIYLIKKSF